MKDERFTFSECTLTRSMAVIGTKWKPIIVWVIQDKKVRFGQLDAYISLITRKVLTEQLKELELDGIVIRESFSETPPRVEYSLTQKGLDLLPILANVVEWYDIYEPNEKYKVVRE